jgi:hypothetical protein
VNICANPYLKNLLGSFKSIITARHKLVKGKTIFPVTTMPILNKAMANKI